MARVFDSKHQAYFCLPKPCPFGEHGEDSCCPSSFSPALCEAMVLISSAPHVCTASALEPCRELASCSWLLTRSLFGKWMQVSAAPGGSSLSQVFNPAPSTFLLPPSSFPAPAQPFSWVLSTSSSRSPCIEAFFLLFLILSASLSEMLWSSSRGRVVWFFFFFPIRHLFLESFRHYSTVWMPHDLLL